MKLKNHLFKSTLDKIVIQDILNFSMITQRFVKSFSSGQVTIPKDFRERLSLGNDFWLRLVLEDNRIIAEPVTKTASGTAYSKKLLGIKGAWFDFEDWKKMRKEVNARNFA